MADHSHSDWHAEVLFNNLNKPAGVKWVMMQLPAGWNTSLHLQINNTIRNVTPTNSANSENKDSG